MTETRYQRIAREQAERQLKRLKARALESKHHQAEYRKARKIAKLRQRDRAYEDWCTSDFPNQSDEYDQSDHYGG